MTTAILAVTSCSLFLEKPDTTGTVDQEAVFSTTKNARAALMSCYRNVLRHGWPGGMGIGHSTYGAISGEVGRGYNWHGSYHITQQGLTVNGRAFKPDTIHRWLCNELFIGRYKYGEQVMPVPAAIDTATWERVQSRKSEARTRYRERTPDFHYFMTGKAVCGTCGGKLCGHPTKTNYNYYYCRNCRKHIIQADKLHDKIKYALYEYLTPEKIKELAAAAYEEYQHSKPEDPTIPLRAELKEVEKRIENGTNAILSGKAPESLLTALRELEERRDTLKKTISECDGISPIFTREHFEYALSQVLEYSVEDIEKLVNIFIDRVIVTKEQVIICINLTNEANDPPLDRVCIERTGE